MFCPSCGAQMPDDIRFCTNCGESLPEAPAADNQTPAANPSPAGVPYGAGSAGNIAYGSAAPAQGPYGTGAPAGGYYEPMQPARDYMMAGQGAQPTARSSRSKGLIAGIVIVSVVAVALIVGILAVVGIIPGFQQPTSTTAAGISSSTVSSSTAVTTSPSATSTQVQRSSSSSESAASDASTSSTKSGTSANAAYDASSAHYFTDTVHHCQILIPAGFSPVSADSETTVFKNPSLQMTITMDCRANTGGATVDSTLSSALSGVGNIDFQRSSDGRYACSFYSPDGATEYYQAGYVNSSNVCRMLVEYPAANSDAQDAIIEEIYPTFEYTG